MPKVSRTISSIATRLSLFATLLAVSTSMPAQTIAPTPPMGWNSWDSYGLSITEEQFKANAVVLAGLKQYGWQVATIDEGWYLENPLKNGTEKFRYNTDANAHFIPDPARFPSAANGRGFRDLASWTHAQGLKFGIHIVRGIPREVVERNAPISASSLHAEDAADRNDLCEWDHDNFGVRDNPAGQAYYDSLLKLYADWGLDFLKVDCIADHPYKASEIRMIANAIHKSGRPILLSLSPGPTNLSHAAEVAQLSQMWRIADDIWDAWSYPGKTWPNGLESAFDNLAKWAAYAKPGNWPDADMLPWGQLKPHPGWGAPRASGLTPDETRAQFTLWAVARSPLILGNNLTLLDDATRALLTNREVIAINQQAVASQQLTLGDPKQFRVWSVTMPGDHKHYVAVFNLTNQPSPWQASWKDLNLDAAHPTAFELWTQAAAGSAKGLSLTLAPHGCALLRIGS